MNLPEDFKEVLEAVTNKRARYVIDTILQKGFCSTEDLKNAGYEHAPRAARDVSEIVTCPFAMTQAYMCCPLIKIKAAARIL